MLFPSWFVRLPLVRDPRAATILATIDPVLVVTERLKDHRPAILPW
jgi:hypothetical protein